MIIIGVHFLYCMIVYSLLMSKYTPTNITPDAAST